MVTTAKYFTALKKKIAHEETVHALSPQRSVEEQDNAQSHDRHANDKEEVDEVTLGLVKAVGGGQQLLQRDVDHHAADEAKADAIDKGTKEVPED